ncbi:MAG: hypothetical protein QNJ29_05530 [Rhizobiaceae bacterium]|nr:hypothetical protein [Rhizobiaceae bacterium]
MSTLKPSYFIGFDGDGLNARPMIQTMLEVSAVQITAHWLLAIDAKPNVIICSPKENPQTQQQYYPVTVSLGDLVEPERFALPKPFRLMQLIELLNGIESHFEVEQKPSSDPALTNDAIITNQVIMAQGLWSEFADFLQNNIVGNPRPGFITIKLSGEHVATIDLAAQQYFRVFNFIKIVSFKNVLECAEVANLPPNPDLDGTSPFPLENLVWLAGLVAGGGKAAPWLPDDKQFMLKSWPNFALYNHNMKMIEMAAKLTKSPFEVSTLAQDVEANESMVWNFMNAVSLLGLCKVIDPSAASQIRPQTAIDTGNQTQSNVSSLIGKLKQHLMKAG